MHFHTENLSMMENKVTKEFFLFIVLVHLQVSFHENKKCYFPNLQINILILIHQLREGVIQANTFEII